MKWLNYFLLLPLTFLLFTCDSIEPKPPDTNPPGHQEDIAWPSLADSPWPMSQHDPQNTGRTNVAGPSNLNIVWSKFIENGMLSGPVVDKNDNLYFGNDQGLSDYFYCLPAKSDSFKWVTQTGDEDRIFDGMIITSSGNIICRGPYIYSVSKEGNINWKYPFDGYRQNYNITLKGNILAVDGSDNLIKLSQAGELLLKTKHDDGFYAGTAISTDGSKILINGKNGYLYCLDLDGSIVWKAYSGKSNIPPLIDSNDKTYVCVIGDEGSVKCFDSDGKLGWEYKVSGGMPNLGNPSLDKNGNFYFWGGDTLSGYLSIFSLDYSGEQRWIYPLADELNRGYIASKIACDKNGNLYFGSDQGYYYYCLNSDGNLLWQYSLNGIEIDGSPAFGSDGTLYFGGHNGEADQKNLFGMKND